MLTAAVGLERRFTGYLTVGVDSTKVLRGDISSHATHHI